jgi:hypothetical protein
MRSARVPESHIRAPSDRLHLVTRSWEHRLIVVAGLLAFCLGLPVPLSRAANAEGGAYDVFFNSQIAGSKAGVFFVDVRTGVSSTAITATDELLLVGNVVLFRDPTTGSVMAASTTGAVTPYPGVTTGDYFSWVASANHHWVTWAVGRRQGNSLVTELYLADAGGTQKSVPLRTSSTKNIGIRPLAVSDDGAVIYYTREEQQDAVSHLRGGASEVYQLTVATGEPTLLSNEPCKDCVTAISTDGRRALRLGSAARGIAGTLYDLSPRLIALTLNLEGVDQKVLSAYMAPGNNQAFYSVLQGSGANVGPYSIIALDLVSKTQRMILANSAVGLRPIQLEQDALLLTTPDKDGTYKLSVSTGTLTQVSAYTYLGTLGAD